MKTQVVRTIEELGELATKLKNHWGVVAFDIETEPFDFKDPAKSHAWQLPLEGIGFYTPDTHGYVIADVALSPAGMAIVQDIINTKVLIVWNQKFEVTNLTEHGFNFDKAQLHDGMIIASLADENQFSFGLKQLAVRVLGVKSSDIVAFKDLPLKPEEAEDIPAWQQQMGNYCVDDCYYTVKLYEHFMKSLFEQGLLDVYNNLERPFIEVLRSMERRGIAVNKDYLLKMGKKLESEVYAIQKAIYAEAGREFNIASTLQLRNLLFEEKGYTLPNDFKTPKGAMSTNKEALAYLSDEEGSELCTMILKYREYAKLLSTYVEGITGKTVHENGMDSIHTTFWQTGTATGRLSSSQPNLQNIGRRDDEFNIRKAFVARPGKSFVTSDYSQIELRIMAFLSGSKNMIDTYKNNGDIHKTTADAVGCDRVVAKGINFGINYGLSPYGLARNINKEQRAKLRASRAKGEDENNETFAEITEEEAEGFIDEYFNKFPEVPAFMNKCVETVQKQGYVEDIFGRRRRFPDYAECIRMGDDQGARRIERQATNAVIQGSAASVIKVAMIKIHEALKPLGGEILLQIHDELVVEVDDDKAEEASVIIKREMEAAASLGEVLLTTEPHITKQWVK